MARYLIDGDSETYRGLVIRVRRDDLPCNPHEDWDGMTPMLVKSGRDEWDYSDSADNLRYPWEHLSDWKIARNWRAVCDAVGVYWFDADKECRRQQAIYGGRLADCRRELLENAACDRSTADEFAGLAYLWKLAGCAALDSSISGHCQGDYADVLAVQTPAWRDRMGTPKPGKRSEEDEARDLRADISTYEAFAFGDVYGYVIETEDGEELDSCWGFYGMDAEESGLWDAATSAADWHAEKIAENLARELEEARPDLYGFASEESRDGRH